MKNSPKKKKLLYEDDYKFITTFFVKKLLYEEHFFEEHLLIRNEGGKGFFQTTPLVEWFKVESFLFNTPLIFNGLIYNVTFKVRVGGSNFNFLIDRGLVFISSIWLAHMFNP